ncbi:hypothetical protein BH23GEM7_BH23GEM7_03020 [soil metagenome]
MSSFKPTIVLAACALLLFTACDRNPLVEDPAANLPDESPIPSGMTAQGPKAGPLSTMAPQIGSFSGPAPTFEVRRGLTLKDIPGGLLPPGTERGLRTTPNSITPLQVQNPFSTGILWEDTVTGQRVIWEMQGAVFTGQRSFLPTIDPSWRMVAGTADFNGDGHADILWQHVPTATVVIWFMEGFNYTGQLVVVGQVADDARWRIVGVGDFDGDGHADILWQHPTGLRAFWFMNGPSFAGRVMPFGPVDPTWDIAGVGDFNRDGMPDILWQHLPTGQRVVWFMNGPNFEGQPVFLPQVDPEWDIAGVGNFYEVGMTDILWQHRSTGWRSIWRMDGTTWTGTGDVLPLVPTEWNMVGAFGAIVPPPPPPPGPLEGSWSYNAIVAGTVGGVPVNCTLANMTLTLGHDEEDVSTIAGVGVGGTWHCGEPEGPTQIAGFNPLTGTYTAETNAVTFSIGGPALWTVTNTGTAAADLNTITGTAQLSIPLGPGSVALSGPFTATRVTFPMSTADAAARRTSEIPTIPSGAALTAQTRATRDVLTAGIEKAVERARAEGRLR